MMTEKIGVLFSENQTNNYDALKGHNKNVIEYNEIALGRY